MGYVDCRRIKTDRGLLLIECLAELFGEYADTCQAKLVEIVEIMRRAGCARSTIRQRDDHCLAVGGYIGDHLARGDAGVGRLLVTASGNAALLAQLLEPVDELIAAHL